MVHELTSENHEALFSHHGIVLIDCWASWCGACKAFTPLFERVAENHPEHLFAKMDTEAEEALRREFEIAHIPALVLFRDGILLFNEASNMSEEELESVITQAESLDMERVRAEIAAETLESEHPAGSSA